MQPLWQCVLRWLFASAAAQRPSVLLRPRGRLAAQEPGSVWDWACLRAGARPDCGSGTLDAITATLGAGELPSVGLVVPGEDALLLEFALPPGNAAQHAAAARYLAEDYLLEDLEAVHVALHGSGVPDRQRVVAINAQCLADALQMLTRAGLSVVSAWVDHELLAGGRDETSSFVDGERLLLCTPGGAGFAGPRGVAVRWCELHGEPALPVDVSRTAFFSALCWPDATEVAVDLLQGQFEPAVRIRERRQCFVRVMGAASLMPMLLLVFALLLGAWHGHRATATRAEARALLAAHQPELARAPSLAQAVEALAGQPTLPAQPDAPAFAELLGVLGAALAEQAPGDRPRCVRLQYRQAQLEVLLDAPSLQTLGALQEGFAARGVNARLVSASRAGERFEGRLRMGHGSA
jgi:type II secretion system protein L